MRAVRHLTHLLWGDDLDDALRPVLGVTFVGTAAGSATWSFLAIWAVDELGAKAALPFALLVGAVLAGLAGFAGGYLWAILFVIVVFVIGEMLWVPTSQAVVAQLAPADIRGAYMGAFGSAPAIGFALAPLIGLQVRNSFGDEATWALFAAIEAALWGIEFFKAHRAEGMLRTIRGLVHRAMPDTREAALLHAMCIETLNFLRRKGIEPGNDQR